MSREALTTWGTRWSSGYGIAEAMDVTGLTNKEAATLALVLANWLRRSGTRAEGGFYTYRDGKRYMRTPLNLLVNLENPVMAPFRDDILAAEEDAASAREFDLEPMYADTEAYGEEFGRAYAEYLQGWEEHPA